MPARSVLDFLTCYCTSFTRIPLSSSNLHNIPIEVVNDMKLVSRFWGDAISDESEGEDLAAEKEPPYYILVVSKSCKKKNSKSSKISKRKPSSRASSLSLVLWICYRKGNYCVDNLAIFCCRLLADFFWWVICYLNIGLDFPNMGLGPFMCWFFF